MDKDRAIQMLERMQNPEPYDPQITSEAFDALQMAIDALSADGDTISRKAALDALDEIETEVADGYGYQYAKWRKYFAELPSAQPERIKGRWIPADTPCGIKCSNCGYPVDDFCYSIDYIDLDYAPNFCPNCGAKMESEVTT